MAESSPWSLFNLPADPPWHSDPEAGQMKPAETGNNRRPLIHPPPKHTRMAPAGLEFAMSDSGNADLRLRLEEQYREDKRRDGHVVYEDLGQYQPRTKWDEAEGGDPASLSSVRTLQFESRFESGNLQRAVKVGPSEYDLYLRPDKNSGHVQWYYFMVRNMKHGVPYIFNIVNFVKNKSLYNAGLRPLIYSDKEARGRRAGIGWHRTGSNCAYYRRGNRYALTFMITFKYEGDTCFFAHCYPYTYTDSQIFLANLLKDPARRAACKRKELCRSLAGNAVDLLEIGETVHDHSAVEKASILLSARVHPGETQASWAIQSCIEFLTSSLPEAKLLRSRFTIYVVPMLNPDGVINGHYRCSMSGQDLNRVWANPDKARHPCIWHTRDLVRILSSQGLSFFCDFHGHSVKKNAFMYGCSAPGNQSYKPASTKAIPPAAMFPLLLDEISPAFSFHDCNFRVQRSKMTSGRVVVNREFGVSNAYTIEISFLGHEVGGCMVHFKIEDLGRIGNDFAVALIKYHLPTQYEMTQPCRSKTSSPKSSGRDGVSRNGASFPAGEMSQKTGAHANDLSDESPQGAHGTRGNTNIIAFTRTSPSQKRVCIPAPVPVPYQFHYSQTEPSPASLATATTQSWIEDCTDNFIRACQNRRETIAQEIRRCEADLEDLTPPAARSQISTGTGSRAETIAGNDGTSKQAPSMPSSAAVSNEVGHEGCSEGDSDDSSDQDVVLDCDGISNLARGLETSEEGEEDSDNDSDSNIDPEVASVIATARAGQPSFRLTSLQYPITAEELLQGCESGFLPKLKIKKFSLQTKDSPLHTGTQRPMRETEALNHSPDQRQLGSRRHVGNVGPTTSWQQSSITNPHLSLGSDEEGGQHEQPGKALPRSTSDSTIDSSRSAHKPGGKPDFEVVGCSGFRWLRAGIDTGGNSVYSIFAAPDGDRGAPSDLARSSSQPAQEGPERLEERAPLSKPFDSGHPVSSAPKLAYLCAAVEGCCTTPTRPPQFPFISNPTMPKRQAASPRGASKLNQVGQRDAELYRLAQRLGAPNDGEASASPSLFGLDGNRPRMNASPWKSVDQSSDTMCEDRADNDLTARENHEHLASHIRLPRQISSNRQAASHTSLLVSSPAATAALAKQYRGNGEASAATNSSATSCTPQPPTRYDNSAQALNRAWHRRMTKSRTPARPGIFSPVAALARTGPSGSQARSFTRQISRDTQEEADGDLRGLAIIASARDPEDAPAGTGVRGRTSVRRSLQITSLTDSSSPRRLAASKASAEPTNENTTFIRMLSALNRKPE